MACRSSEKYYTLIIKRALFKAEWSPYCGDHDHALVLEQFKVNCNAEIWEYGTKFKIIVSDDSNAALAKIGELNRWEKKRKFIVDWLFRLLGYAFGAVFVIWLLVLMLLRTADY